MYYIGAGSGKKKKKYFRKFDRTFWDTMQFLPGVTDGEKNSKD